MYSPSAVPYGPASCRSMKTAQPASLPPGVCGSGGINRSTSASTAAPSSAVKYVHGPGFTAVGGAPAFGSHGMRLWTTPAKTEFVENNKVVAVVSINSRRRMPDWRRDGLGVPLPASSGELGWSLLVIIGLPHIKGIPTTYFQISTLWILRISYIASSRGNIGRALLRR